MPLSDPVTVKGDKTLVPPAEVREIGDNSGAEERAFKKAVTRMLSLNAERKALNARIGKARKEMKADGIALKHLDATIAMLEWSPAEQREHFDVQARYARYMQLPVGTQLDLLMHAEDEEVAAEDWRSRGRSDAIRLQEAAVPKGCPPEHHQHYLEGHAQGKWWSSEAADA